MKKRLTLIIISLFALLINFPVFNAQEYKTHNLEETLKEENIEPAFSNYKENKKQVTIYMFRGKNCGFCVRFLKFLNSITDEYGKYFKLQSYEVWNDSENSKLMKEVAAFMGENVTGVPFIVIGDKAFRGYKSDYDEDIKKAIMDLYNSKKRYDVFAKMNNDESEEDGDSNLNIWIIVADFVFALGTIIAIFMYNNKRFNKIEEEIKKLSKVSAKEDLKVKTKETKSNKKIKKE